MNASFICRLAISLELVIALSGSLRAQAAARVRFGGDSLGRLTAGFTPELNAALKRYLTGSDTAARNALVRGAMMTVPAGMDFALAVISKEPNDSTRWNVIRQIGGPRAAEWAGRPRTVPVLQERIRNDPSPLVVRTAVASLRAVALASTGLRSALADRIGRAKASRDTAILSVAIAEDEALAYAEAGIVAPAFLYDPPPVFSAAPANQPIRVLAFGDYGTAHYPPGSPVNSHQTQLAAVMRAYHAKHPFTFGLTTGDNFYPRAFQSPDAPEWKVTWEQQYDALGIPFFISLGNHDWSEAGPMAERVYSARSKSWKFPAMYYTYTAGPAQFFAVNTNNWNEGQLSWLRRELSRSTAKFKFVYGHFPAFEQTNYTVEKQQELVVPLLKEFKVDALLSGHHHSVQHWIVDGVSYIVAGAGGATNYSLGDTTNVDPRRKFMRSAPAFAVLDVTNTGWSLRFVGLGENVLYEYAVKK